MSTQPPVSLKAMIVGFGKCGSRMCYDVFACSHDKPLSYNLRVMPLSAFERFMQEVDKKLQALMTTLFGTTKLPIQVRYAIVDSDRENEIGSYIEFIQSKEPSGQKLESTKGLSFPGERLQLGTHETGCDYGIVSEAIAHKTNLNARFEDPAMLRIWATSLAGGTGSGSCLEAIRAFRQSIKGTVTHNLVVGILPSEPSEVINGTVDGEPEKTTAINAGRFLTKWLGSYDDSNGRGDGLLLASNSTANFLSSSADKLFLPESLVNSYCARAIFQMANANSRYVACSPDFDVIEMTNRFSGGPILVGQAYERVEASADRTINTDVATRVVRHALANPKLVKDDAPMGDVAGLSIPLRSSEIDELDASLSTGRIFQAGWLAEKPVPLEFRTAETVVVLAAFSANGDVAIRKEQVQKLANEVFFNSDMQFYEMESKTGFDNVVFLIINPFIRQAQRLIYSYITHSWGKNIPAEQLGIALDQLLQGDVPIVTAESGGKSTVAPELSALIEDRESVSRQLLGDETGNLLEKYSGIPLAMPVLAKALERMRQFYRHKRKRSPKSNL